MNNVSLFLLIHLMLTLQRGTHKRDGHSTRTYYISERLPLEACPVILGEILWRHVIAAENEEGISGYQATATQCKSVTTQEEPQIRSEFLLISISLVFVMQIWKLHLHVMSKQAHRLLLAEGWFLESDIKADWCIQLPNKINDVFFFISHTGKT